MAFIPSPEVSPLVVMRWSELGSHRGPHLPSEVSTPVVLGDLILGSFHSPHTFSLRCLRPLSLGAPPTPLSLVSTPFIIGGRLLSQAFAPPQLGASATALFPSLHALERRLRFDQNNSGLINGSDSISDPVARRISYTGSYPSARGSAQFQFGSAQLGSAWLGSRLMTWHVGQLLLLTVYDDLVFGSGQLIRVKKTRGMRGARLRAWADALPESDGECGHVRRPILTPFSPVASSRPPLHSGMLQGCCPWQQPFLFSFSSHSRYSQLSQSSLCMVPIYRHDGGFFSSFQQLQLQSMVAAIFFNKSCWSMFGGDGCPELISIPGDFRELKYSLKILSMYNLKLGALSSGLQCCTSLEELYIWDCRELIHISDLQELSSLRILEIRGCDKLFLMFWLFQIEVTCHTTLSHILALTFSDQLFRNFNIEGKMVQSTDPFWHHVEEMKCIYCGRQFPNDTSISRIKWHLSGEKGRGVAICERVPKQVQEAAFLAMHGANKRHKSIASSSNVKEMQYQRQSWWVKHSKTIRRLSGLG
ncbi:hypothetical protein NC652_040444 [Populus alba x Populus x berolinensis]|nr:hypothetical protein NC652_040444 [Populus alba x Populus x berolinensis]